MNRFNRVFRIGVLFLFPVVCLAGDVKLLPHEELPPVVSDAYRLTVGDELDVSFFKTPEFDRKVVVGPDGEVYLPLIGRTRVAGRTLDELNHELTDRYKDELVSPQITVGVSKYSGLLVYVGGEVNEPGMVPYRGGMSAVQAIMDAGGFKTTAKLKQVLLIRRGDADEPVGSIVNVKRILAKHEFGQDVALAPEDVLFVPRTNIANVNLFIEEYVLKTMPIPPGFGINIDAD